MCKRKTLLTYSVVARELYIINSEKLWFEHDFRLRVPCDIDVMTLQFGNESLLGHGHQLF